MLYKQNFLDLLFNLKDYATDEFYKEADIFNFNSLDHNNPLLKYTSFIYKQLDNPNESFKIEQERFELFLLKKDSPDAFAHAKNGNNIIGIHLGLFDLVEYKINERAKRIKAPIISVLNNEAELPKIEYLIFRFNMFFIYFHELAHLIQSKNKSADTELYNERYFFSIGNKFCHEKHAKEIDADLFAAQMLTDFVLQNWSGMPERIKSMENLQSFIALASASIFFLFFKLNNGKWPEIYFFENEHPHPTIRISYITDAIANLAIKKTPNNSGNLFHDKCILEAFEIAEQLLNEERAKAFIGYKMQYLPFLNDIDKYFKEMSLYSKGLPFLIQNLVKR